MDASVLCQVIGQVSDTNLCQCRNRWTAWGRPGQCHHGSWHQRFPQTQSETHHQQVTLVQSPWFQQTVWNSPSTGHFSTKPMIPVNSLLNTPSTGQCITEHMMSSNTIWNLSTVGHFSTVCTVPSNVVQNTLTTSYRIIQLTIPKLQPETHQPQVPLCGNKVSCHPSSIIY